MFHQRIADQDEEYWRYSRLDLQESRRTGETGKSPRNGYPLNQVEPAVMISASPPAVF